MAETVVGKATYETEVDSSGLKRGLASAEGDIKHAGGVAEDAFGNKAAGGMSKFQGIGIGAIAGVSGAITSFGIGAAMGAISGVVDNVGKSITLASDKAEAASKANIIFGNSYSIIEEASKSAATTVGMSSGAYLAAAGDLGNLTTNMGFTGEKAAGMSKDMLQLAADVGSFNNADPTEVVQAMGAAFRGEAEPIRKFGVMLSEARVQEEAVRLGLVGSTKAFSELDFATKTNIKAQATYSLILQDTSKAQGDRARTADSLANIEVTAAAKQEEAWTNLGEKLAPLAQTLVPMLADAVAGLVDFVTGLIGGIQEWVDANQPLIKQLSDLWDMVATNLGPALKILGIIIGAVGQVLGGLVGIIVDTIGAVVDLGAVLVNVFAGKWEEAAAHGALAMGRLQGVQENMQRVMGDGQRIFLDNQVSAHQAADAQRLRSQKKYWEETQGASEKGWQQIIYGANTGTDNLASTVEGGVPGMANAAGDLAGTLPDAMKKANVDAKAEAARTPGQIASGLRSTRDDWRSALDLLKDDMSKSQDATAEIAALKGKLIGRRLTQGLASDDPIVRAQALETQRLIKARLEELEGIAHAAGTATGNALASALLGTRLRAVAAAYTLARSVQQYLQINSPAELGPWSEGGGPIEWMASAGRHMRDALFANLAGPVDVPRLLGLDGLTMQPLLATANLEVRHVVALDLANAPVGVTNAGVAAMLNPVMDWDAQWSRKLDEAQAATNRRWVGPVL